MADFADGRVIGCSGGNGYMAENPPGDTVPDLERALGRGGRT